MCFVIISVNVDLRQTLKHVTSCKKEVWSKQESEI